MPVHWPRSPRAQTRSASDSPSANASLPRGQSPPVSALQTATSPPLASSSPGILRRSPLPRPGSSSGSTHLPDLFPPSLSSSGSSPAALSAVLSLLICPTRQERRQECRRGRLESLLHETCAVDLILATGGDRLRSLTSETPCQAIEEQVDHWRCIERQR